MQKIEKPRFKEYIDLYAKFIIIELYKNVANSNVL